MNDNLNDKSIQNALVWYLINFFLQPRFSYKVGDGVCDQLLNNAECCYDGNDCKSFASECSQCPRDFVRILRLHKGKCLPSFNTPQCCYSLGACSNINECSYSAKLPLVQKYTQVCAYCICMTFKNTQFSICQGPLGAGEAKIYTMTRWWCHRRKHLGSTYAHVLPRKVAYLVWIPSHKKLMMGASWVLPSSAAST